MLPNWLDGVLVVVEALLVYLQMLAPVLESTEGGTFESHHNHLGGGYIFATVAHNLEILVWHWWLVVNCMSC
jgi:hypothetical protein